MDDLIGEFIAETSESLAVLSGELARLQHNPGNGETLETVARLVHTIKGTCGFLGFRRLESVAQAVENALGNAAGGEGPSPQTVEVVVAALARISQLVTALAATGAEPEGEDKDILSPLATVQAGSGKPAAKPARRPTKPTSLPPALTQAPAAQSQHAEVNSSPQAAPANQATPPVLSAQVKEKAIRQGLETASAERRETAEPLHQPEEWLHTMHQAAEELGLLRQQLQQLARHTPQGLLSRPLSRLAAISARLEYGVLKARMQPIARAWAALPGLVQQWASADHKQIGLTLSGEKCLLDPALVEALQPPIAALAEYVCHVIITPPGARRASGRHSAASLSIAAHEEGGLICITMTADDQIADMETLRQKAAQAGQVPIAEVSDEEALRALLLAEMPLYGINAQLAALGATLQLTAQAGVSTVTIRLSPTRAVAAVTLVRAGAHRLAIPQHYIAETLHSIAGYREQVAGLSVLRLHDRLVPLLCAATQMGSAPQNAQGGSILLLRVNGGEIGLGVDSIEESGKLALKPLGKWLQGVRLYTGCVITPQGEPVLVLDPAQLAGRASAHAAESPAARLVTIGNGLSHGASFLLVRAGGGTKAIPLDLVTRLETVDAGEIRHTGLHAVVERPSGPYVIHTLPGADLPRTGPCKLVLFGYDGQTVALRVEEVLDIVAAPVTMVSHTENGPFLGSVMIGAEMIEVVNIAPLLAASANSAQVARAHAAEKQSLLLVEENYFYRALLTPLLEAAGWQVMAAENAGHAEALLQAAPALGALLLDLRAAECISRIRQLGYTGLPVIAYHNAITPELEQRSAATGAAALRDKADRPALIEALQQYVAKEQHA